MRRQTAQYLLLFIAILTALGAWVAWPGNRDLLGKDARVVKGLDLQGGLQVLLEAKPAAAGQSVTGENMDDAKLIVEQRVNGLGVSEPLVQRQGANRIVVELPGENRPEQAIRTIQGTGQLEFVDVGDAEPNPGTLVNTTLGPATQADNPSAAATVSPDGSPPAVVPADGTPSQGATGSPAAASPTPAATGAAGQTTPAPTATPDPALAITPPEQLAQTYTTIMTGKDITKANAQFDSQRAQWVVSFSLSGEGAKKFGDFTSANVGKRLAIVLDKKVVSAPTIQGAITGGQGEITGVGIEEAKSLAIQLRSGELPVKFDVISSNTVGASLGRDSVDRSITAGLIGVLGVALFMILYYRLPGLISVLALGIYALLVFAIFKLIPVVLTLAGIAGFVLSIGMAVDANVLIFARVKEELRRGRPLLQAVDAGFRNAWPSIRDSNVSTLITCAVLVWFGQQFGASVIRGFAITLAIGVLVSMFTAIIVTRTFLAVVVRFAAARSIWLWGIRGDEVPVAAPRPGAGPALGGSRAR